MVSENGVGEANSNQCEIVPKVTPILSNCLSGWSDELFLSGQRSKSQEIEHLPMSDSYPEADTQA